MRLNKIVVLLYAGASLALLAGCASKAPLTKPESEIVELYSANKGKYKILKEALIEDLDAFIKPMREKRAKIIEDMKGIEKVLADGAYKAKAKADAKLLTIKKNIGVL